MPTLRVVLDTNVLVSGLAYPASIPGRIVGAWRQGALEVVLSRHILDELTRVLSRLNHRLKWRPVDFADLADILAIEIDLVEPQPLAGDTVRDAADIPVLGTLLAAKADYLITGDHDLLALAEPPPNHHPRRVLAATWWVMAELMRGWRRERRHKPNRHAGRECRHPVRRDACTTRPCVLDSGYPCRNDNVY